VAPYNNIHSDSDEATPSDPGSDKAEEPDGHEPLEDFTANPPNVYNLSFWEPSYINVEDHLSLDSHIFSKVDIPCGIRRYDVSVVGK
jgi:hypothetical protein